MVIEMFCILTGCDTALEFCTIRGNWVMGSWDPVLFIKIARVSTVPPNKKVIN